MRLVRPWIMSSSVKRVVNATSSPLRKTKAQVNKKQRGCWQGKKQDNNGVICWSLKYTLLCISVLVVERILTSGPGWKSCHAVIGWVCARRWPRKVFHPSRAAPRPDLVLDLGNGAAVAHLDTMNIFRESIVWNFNVYYWKSCKGLSPNHEFDQDKIDILKQLGLMYLKFYIKQSTKFTP